MGAAPGSDPRAVSQGRTAAAVLSRLLSWDVTFFGLLVLTTVTAIAAGALSEDRKPFGKDDEHIYVRVTRLFEKGMSLELLRRYEGEPASPAPLFFVVYAAIGRILGSSYLVYRSVSLVITLLATLGVWAYTRFEAPRDERHCFPQLLYLFPYIFCMGFSVMAEPLTLLLTVLGLIGYLHGLTRRSDTALLLGTLTLTAALHVRIHPIFAPVTLMLIRRLRHPARGTVPSG